MKWVEKALSLRVRNHGARGGDRTDWPGGAAAPPCPGSRFRRNLVRFLVCAAVLSGVVLSNLFPRLLLADGGTLRVSNVPMGAYRVYVFTDPTPIPPDTLDVSVLVTFERGRGLATGLEILVVGRRLDAPGPEVTRAATREQADDPRYYAAHFSLGSEGSWELEVRLRGPEGEGEVRFKVEVLEPGLGDSPFFILGLAVVPLILVGWWLRRSGGPPAPPEAPESGPRDP
jgi:hypothetical protein